MDNYQPLVSIVIVTYNSEDTVIETLNSAISQTYNNVEIVISDDCSKDATVNVIKTWIETKKSEFLGVVKLLESEKNQGVCKNLNKGIRNSSGQYIKIIAGDDKLLPNCCSDFIGFVTDNPCANFVTSYLRTYNETFNEENLVKTGGLAKGPSIYDKPVDVQLKQMAYNIFVSAPTMFFSRKLYDMVGGFDERYLYEDHPFYMNILESGQKIHLLKKETVAYRIHQSTFNTKQKLFNYQFSRSSKRFRKERCFKYYGFRQRMAVNLYYSLLTLIEFLHLNKKNKVSQFVFRVLTKSIWWLGR